MASFLLHFCLPFVLVLLFNGIRVSSAPLLYYSESTSGVSKVDAACQHEMYFPETTFNISVSSSPSSSRSLEDPALEFLSHNLGFNKSDIVFYSGFTDDIQRVAYFRQIINGIPVANAVANVVLQGNNITSYSSSFMNISAEVQIAAPEPTAHWIAVVPAIEKCLYGRYNGVNATLEYLVTSSTSIALTHVIQIQNKDSNTWYEAYIDAHTGDLVSVVDFVAHASYTAIPIAKSALLNGVQTMVNPQDTLASPFGWHSSGLATSNTTEGNNGVVRTTTENALAFQTTGGQNFNVKYDNTKPPADLRNVEAALTNVFYTVNMMHDVSYRYGFTEHKFNFQQTNFQNDAGKSNDSVHFSIQDPFTKNSASFATPPDGQSPIGRISMFNYTGIDVEGAMQTDILAHELTHGITNRLTGGGSGRCLQTLEAKGLGEGWSDSMADWMSQTSDITRDFVIGSVDVTGTLTGLRKVPYSTNSTINGQDYRDLRGVTDIHDIGEIWATILHEVYANLVDSKGFADDRLTNPDSRQGNVVFMRLFMDALSIQPCNPTFTSARDAWYAADQARYQGEHLCTLSRAFAARGLGVGAGRMGVDSHVNERGCEIARG